MASLVQAFIRDLEVAKKSLSAAARAGKQLQSDSKRADLRVLSEKYFASIRPSILPAHVQDAEIAHVDAQMQKLIELCHRRGLARAYTDLLAEVRKRLIQVDMRTVSQGPGVSQSTQITDADRLIVSTLDSVVPSASSSYRQALVDLDSADRLSWRGPATDLRECLRETLDHFAPDAEVIKEPGFKQEPNTNGPTMKQKVRYVLRLRGQSKSQSGATEHAVESVEESLGMFVRSVYTRSNLSTHTATSKDEVLRVRSLVRVALSELLEIRL